MQATFLGFQLVEGKTLKLAHTVKVLYSKSGMFLLCHFCLWTTQTFQDGPTAGHGVHSITVILKLEYIEGILYVEFAVTG